LKFYNTPRVSRSSGWVRPKFWRQWSGSL